MDHLAPERLSCLAEWCCWSKFEISAEEAVHDERQSRLIDTRSGIAANGEGTRLVPEFYCSTCSV
jgi:hypothetical protein